MEPPHQVFVKRHNVSKGKHLAEEKEEQAEDMAECKLSPLSRSGRSSLSISTSDEREPWSRRFIYSVAGREETVREQTIHSVFLATGLFMDADEHLDQIPVRFKASPKSALRWFIDLCMAGLGKVEFIKCTTVLILIS